MSGLSTTGSISLGCALVAGRNRVPRPAAGRTALRTRRLLFVIRGSGSYSCIENWKSKRCLLDRPERPRSFDEETAICGQCQRPSSAGRPKPYATIRKCETRETTWRSVSLVLSLPVTKLRLRWLPTVGRYCPASSPLRVAYTGRTAGWCRNWHRASTFEASFLLYARPLTGPG